MQNSGHKNLIAAEMNLESVKFVGGSQNFQNSPQKKGMGENEMKSLINQHHVGTTPQGAKREGNFEGKQIISERTRGTPGSYASASTNQTE